MPPESKKDGQQEDKYLSESHFRMIEALAQQYISPTDHGRIVLIFKEGRLKFIEYTSSIDTDKPLDMQGIMISC